MNKFSEQSRTKLSTCHPDIQLLMTVVLRKRDITIIHGFRNEELQNKLYAEGRSKLKFPASAHNFSINEDQKNIPYSKAADIAPYPVMFAQPSDSKHLAIKKVGRFYMLAQLVLDTAEDLKIDIRWGGDWNQDQNIMNNNFDDLGHFELI